MLAVNPPLTTDADSLALAMASPAPAPLPSVVAAAGDGAALPTLSSLVSQHNAHMAALKDHSDKQRREALAAVGAVTDGLASAVNDGVARIFVAQRKIDAEARQLQSNAAKFSKQTAAWIKLVDQFNTALKEVGDIQTWAKTIEADMQVVCATLEAVQRDNRDAAASALPSSASASTSTAAAAPTPLIVPAPAAAANEPPAS
jgi:hypothetical protein